MKRIGSSVIVAILLGASLTLTAPESQRAFAQPNQGYTVDPAMNFGNPMRERELARLYDLLKKTQSDIEAHGLSRAIWIIWLHHGDPKVDELMERAMAARRESNYKKALEILNQIIQLAPGYAEGWNQRATIFFLKGDYERSLADVSEVLKREPNHFGALAGRGVIRYRQGKSSLAIQSILEALKVHPRLQERRLLRELGYEEA